MYFDFIRRFWNRGAYERYKIYKKNKNKKQKYNINEFGLLFLQTYLQTHVNNIDVVDDIIEESIHSGIGVNHKNKWGLISVISKFNKKVYIDEIRQRYNIQ
jgi:hypothetical protein